MKFQHVSISGTATVTPPQRLTSADIEERLAPLYQRLRLPEGRLELMTGITARHFWDQPILPSAASAEAGEKLLQDLQFDRGQIDLVVHCGVCRDRLEPATAAYVHGLLGLPATCQILDISNACLGFVNAMVLAGGLIESGQIRHALLVSGENGRPLLEHTLQTLLSGDFTRNSVKPYFANLTIGAGAAAMLLSHREAALPGACRLLGGAARTDSGANQLCQGDAAGSDALQMLTEAEALLDAGIALAAGCWAAFTAATGWCAATPDCFVCHQVGRTHQRRLFEKLGLDLSRDVVTYDEMGNMGSVSLPFTFNRAVASGQLGPAGRAALLGIGSGLSSVMLAVEGPDA